MNGQRWQDWLTALLGVWVFASPWLIAGAAVENLALWSHLILGAAVVVLGLAAIFAHRLWEEWLNVVLGLALAVSPWVLGFSGMFNLVISDVVAGLAVAALAGWMATREQTQGI